MLKKLLEVLNILCGLGKIFYMCWKPTRTVADLHTKVSGTRPSPNRTKFFCFYICFHRKHCVGGWCPLQRGLAPPQQEILDPPLQKCSIEIQQEMARAEKSLPTGLLDGTVSLNLQCSGCDTRKRIINEVDSFPVVPVTTISLSPDQLVLSNSQRTQYSHLRGLCNQILTNKKAVGLMA